MPRRSKVRKFQCLASQKTKNKGHNLSRRELPDMRVTDESRAKLSFERSFQFNVMEVTGDFGRGPAVDW